MGEWAGERSQNCWECAKTLAFFTKLQFEFSVSMCSKRRTIRLQSAHSLVYILKCFLRTHQHNQLERTKVKNQTSTQKWLMNQWWRHLTPQLNLSCISPFESLFSLDTCRIVKKNDTGSSCAESIDFQCKLEEEQNIPITEINSVYSMAASVRQKQVGLITSECYKWCYHCNQLTVVYNMSKCVWKLWHTIRLRKILSGVCIGEM